MISHDRVLFPPSMSFVQALSAAHIFCLSLYSERNKGEVQFMQFYTSFVVLTVYYIECDGRAKEALVRCQGGHDVRERSDGIKFRIRL